MCIIGHFVNLSDVTVSRDSPFKATQLAWLSYTKINWRKQRFQKCMLEFGLLFGTKWPFLGYWPMDYVSGLRNDEGHGNENIDPRTYFFSFNESLLTPGTLITTMTDKIRLK